MIAGITDRQEELKLLKYDSVAIAGCGGVGSWVALFLILSGQVNRLSVFDADKLESHNLNRLPYRIEDIDKNKAEALKEFLSTIRESSMVMAYAKDCSPFLLKVACPGLNALIDCTDRLDSQKELSSWAEDQGILYIRVGVTTNNITISHMVSDWEIGQGAESPRCGVTIPAWISPCVIAASYGVAKLLKYPKLVIGGEVNSLITNDTNKKGAK